MNLSHYQTVVKQLKLHKLYLKNSKHQVFSKTKSKVLMYIN